MFYLTELLGVPVLDGAGKKVGKVTDLAAVLATQPPRVKMVLFDAGGRTPCAAPIEDVEQLSAERVRLRVSKEALAGFHPDEGMLLLRKDLLDQQVIDVHGRKVVRVNDLSLEPRAVNHHSELLLWEVDVGLRGAFRRLFIGAVPKSVLRKVETHVTTTTIPWEVVNLIEPDPRRQVKLNISHKRLAKLHPADLADIVEDLPHKERQAIITSLDDVTAAEALSEVDPKMQVSIVESMDTARAADIVEEMPPDAAADLLGDLSEETSSELLHDMNREDAAELGELLEFHEHSAGGMMTTDYVAIPAAADVRAARELIAGIPDLPENLHSIYLVEDDGRFAGAVPVSKLVVAAGNEKLLELKSEPLLSIPADASEDEVIELVDKYNLLTLPVVDAQQHLIGMVTADDVISVLRKRL